MICLREDCWKNQLLSAKLLVVEVGCKGRSFYLKHRRQGMRMLHILPEQMKTVYPAPSWVTKETNLRRLVGIKARQSLLPARTYRIMHSSGQHMSRLAGMLTHCILLAASALLGCSGKLKIPFPGIKRNKEWEWSVAGLFSAWNSSAAVCLAKGIAACRASLAFWCQLLASP